MITLWSEYISNSDAYIDKYIFLSHVVYLLKLWGYPSLIWWCTFWWCSCSDRLSIWEQGTVQCCFLLIGLYLSDPADFTLVIILAFYVYPIKDTMPTQVNNWRMWSTITIPPPQDLKWNSSKASLEGQQVIFCNATIRKGNNGFPVGICPHFRLQYWSLYWICTQHPTWSYLILRAIPAIHEINALREVLCQRVGKGKFLLKSNLHQLSNLHRLYWQSSSLDQLVEVAQMRCCWGAPHSSRSYRIIAPKWPWGVSADAEFLAPPPLNQNLTTPEHSCVRCPEAHTKTYLTGHKLIGVGSKVKVRGLDSMYPHVLSMQISSFTILACFGLGFAAALSEPLRNIELICIPSTWEYMESKPGQKPGSDNRLPFSS